MRTLAAFLGGAIVGAAAAVLFAPYSGNETREKVRDILRKYGVVKGEEEDAIVEQIVAEIESETK